MNKEIQRQANEIANKVGEGKKVGFVELLIPVITALLPVLIEKFLNCTKSNPVASSPQKFVQHRYDDETEQYDRKLLRLMIDEVREAAKKKGQKLSKSQAEEVAIATLDQTRLAENKVMGACLRGY